LFSLVFDNINFINIYAHSGSNYRKHREELFTKDIVPHLSNRYPNVIVGDFNCIIEEDDTNSSTKNVCIGLKKLISSLKLRDAERFKNTSVKFTFFRAGVMSRLDRMYCSFDVLSNVRTVEVMPTAFSDHHAVLMQYKVMDANCITFMGRGYWKINPSLMRNAEVSNNFILYYDSLKRNAGYEHNLNVWWNLFAKHKVKSYFKSESFHLNEEIRSHKAFLYACLKQISAEMSNGSDVSMELSYVRSKLMEIENKRLQNLAFKFQTNNLAEEEKLGLYQISTKINRGPDNGMLKLKVDNIIFSDYTI
jgi:hypothetical protein